MSFPSFSSPPWDVFLSFYGKDTRNSFTSHLYSALDLAAIRTYRDDPELEKGEHISSGLLKAIQDSKVSIVVLSQNYALSSWCLNELVQIASCKKTKGLLVFPVFYHVDPSVVRYQKGSFGQALEIHKKRYSVDQIEKWRVALTEIADLSGFHIEKDSTVNESDTIQQILKDVAPQVSTKALHLEEHLVGIDSAVEEIYEKLSMHSNDVRAIGICGMGGIGKTTIAKAFYNKHFDKFHSCCFVQDVKRTLQGQDNLLSILKQLLVQLLRRKDFNVSDVESGIRKLNEIFFSRKVLIVLDDFDESDDLELLVSRCNLFSPESRIIMTTRDTNLLSRLEIDIYMVKKLGENESLELFSYHAFRTTIPSEDFRELSKSFVSYVDGLPLALKVLGSSLRRRTMPFWKSKLQRVRETPENDIHKILKLSYDELSDTKVKAIFLDIVFFFLGYDKDEAVWIFESCGFFPDNGIPILVERCLLTIEDNVFKMHNLIRDMGREVIRQESQESGKSKLLLCQGDAFELLKNQEGTNKIEGLILDLTTWRRKHLSTKQLETNLRLLEIINAPADLKISFENSFQELRCIRWQDYPWTYLPSSFHPTKLVSLDMQFSNLKTIWKGSLPLVNLKSLNSSFSKFLKTTPDFSKVEMLEKISLSCCTSLLKIHPSIVQLSELSHLDFSNCCNLKRLPEKLGDMKGLKILDATNTAIEQLPDSISQLRQLDVLNIEGCMRLRKLPEKIGNIKSLRTFDANNSAIEQLPDSFEGLVHLVSLVLYNCKNLRCLPNNIWKLSSLKVLNLYGCSNLDRLPEQFGKMKCLKRLVVSYTAIEEVTDSIGQLRTLKRLDLTGRTKLGSTVGGIWDLTSLENLGLWKSNSLENLPKNVKSLEWLSLMRGKIRLCLPRVITSSSFENLNLIDVGESYTSAKPLSHTELYYQRFFKSEYHSSPESPLANLQRFSFLKFVSLKRVPDLSRFIQLKVLWISKCNPLPPHLIRLDLDDFMSLREGLGRSDSYDLWK